MGQDKGTTFPKSDVQTDVPIRTPMWEGPGADDLGNMSRTWVLFFQKLRILGPPGPAGEPGPGGGGGGTGGGDHWIINEVPAGAADGTNKVFTLAETPDDDTSVMVFLNGVLQHLDDDITVSGDTITFAYPPQPNDYELRATYRVTSGG